jgi:hypothetical protein
MVIGLIKEVACRLWFGGAVELVTLPVAAKGERDLIITLLKTKI